MAVISAKDCKSPYFAYQKDGQWRIKRGSCNRWECERCQHFVASQHYGRIVQGVKEIAGEKEETLWFITITCKGKDMPLKRAKEEYMRWTNHLLTLMRKDAKKTKQFWAYCQVTELQKRGHPHSHIITSYKPNGAKKEPLPERENHYVSEWLQNAIVNAGLGEQYDISMIENPEAASRYVAKYMFKESQFKTEFPRHWRRVRYSQSWPKLPEYETEALPLVKREHWLNLATIAVSVSPDNESVSETISQLKNTGVLIRLPIER